MLFSNSTLLTDELAISLKGKDLISIHDLSSDQIMRIFELARALKSEQKEGGSNDLLKGKTLGMIFTKSSTRTRVSFEVGMWQLGGYALFLSSSDIQLGRGETIHDTAQVLSRYVDGIMIRTFAHSDVEDLAKFASIPVINGLTDLLHPCQALADYFTAYERFGALKGRKLAFIGDGNNVAHSLMYGGAKLGVNVTVACPKGYEPDSDVLEKAKADAKDKGSQIEIVESPEEAALGADILYTDVWASMGQEAEVAERRKALGQYRIDSHILRLAKPHAVVMHCLPAHRGEEITDEVIDGPQSVVFDEAENRLHVQKAIMALLMAD